MSRAPRERRLMGAILVGSGLISSPCPAFAWLLLGCFQEGMGTAVGTQLQFHLWCSVFSFDPLTLTQSLFLSLFGTIINPSVIIWPLSRLCCSSLFRGMLLGFLICANICTTGDKQNCVICVTLTTDESDLKGLKEFPSICLVNSLKRLVSKPGEITRASKQFYLHRQSTACLCHRSSLESRCWGAAGTLGIPDHVDEGSRC